MLEVRGYKIPDMVKIKEVKKDNMTEEFPVKIKVGVGSEGDGVMVKSHKSFTKKDNKFLCQDTGKSYPSLEEAVGESAKYMAMEMIKAAPSGNSSGDKDNHRPY